MTRSSLPTLPSWFTSYRKLRALAGVGVVGTEKGDIVGRKCFYLNGIYKTDVVKGLQYYNTSVSPGTYTIGTRTVDINGNINATMKTHTATTIILPPVRFINGTITDSANKKGIAGAKVFINTSISTMTNVTGFYSLPVTSGTHNLMTTFEPTYYTNSSITVSTKLSAVVVQNIELVKKPTGNITGNVTKA